MDNISHRPCNSTRPNYDEYIRSPKWLQKRLAALARAGYKCQLCSSTIKLHTHHNSYDHLGNEPMEDLCVMCERCHSLYHKWIDVRTRVSADGPLSRKDKKARRRANAKPRILTNGEINRIRFEYSRDKGVGLTILARKFNCHRNLIEKVVADIKR